MSLAFRLIPPTSARKNAIDDSDIVTFLLNVVFPARNSVSLAAPINNDATFFDFAGWALWCLLQTVAPAAVDGRCSWPLHPAWEDCQVHIAWQDVGLRAHLTNHEMSSWEFYTVHTILIR